MLARKRHLLAVAAIGAAGLGVIAATSAIAQARPGRAANAQTLHLVEKGGGIRIVDNPPKARHQYDFSPGDIVIVTRKIVGAGSGSVGSLRLVCIATSATTQQCTGTEQLGGGVLELAGISSPAPSTTAAVIGGTGLYSGARGTSVSSDRKANPDIADQTITLLG